MAETVKVFGSRPDSATMVEGDRVEFRRIFAIKQDDGNIKLFDLLRQVRIVFAARRHDHGIDPALLEDPHQIELALLALVGNGQQQRIAAAAQDLFSSVDDRAEAGNRDVAHRKRHGPRYAQSHALRDAIRLVFQLLDRLQNTAADASLTDL